VLHGEAVAGEGVGGVQLQDFIEGGDLVHDIDGAVWWAGLASFCSVADCETHVRRSGHGAPALVALVFSTQVCGDLDL
jgi:hypothetical protein